MLVLAGGLNGPDDLLYVEGDGAILVGEHGDGHIARLDVDGRLARLPQVVPEVEGIAQMAGVTYVADQYHARVLALTDAGGVRTVLQLEPVASGENLDGIAADKDVLVVPDSPHGTVLFVDASGRVLRRVGGFSRPAGASIGLQSRYLIADENASAVFGLGLAGGPSVLYRNLPGVDDVVQDVFGDGHVFAIVPGYGRLVDLTAGSILVRGLHNPQGLGFDGARNLLVTESDTGRLDLVLRSFLLDAPGATLQLARGQPVCIGVTRAPKDGEPVHVEAASNAGYDSTPTTGNAVEVVPDPCLAGVCTATVTVRGDSGVEYASFSYRD